MPSITNIHLSISGSYLLMFALLLAGALSVYFTYRKTTPPVNLRRRILLAVIRAAALFMIIAILFTPFLSFSITDEIKPDIALLIDTSSSMDIADNGKSRRETVVEMLKSPFFQDLQGQFNVHTWSFRRNSTEFGLGSIDTLKFDGEGTDISGAMKAAIDNAKDYDLRYMILISDGIYNVGENPVNISENSGIPVFSIGIGDPSPKKDALISNIQYNEITYTGNTVPVTISVKSAGYEGATAVVSLMEDGKVLGSAVLRLPTDNMERSVTLNYEALSAGNHKLRVNLSAQNREILTDNNEREFFLKALENKVNILVLSGRPNQDYNFIKQSLEKIKDFSLTGLIQKSIGYYSADVQDIVNRLETFNLFLLIDFPGTENIDEVTRKVLDEIRINNKPVMFIRGKRLSRSVLNAFGNIFALDGFSERGAEEEIYLSLKPSALDHPVFRLFEDPGENAANWNKLPPVFTGPAIPVPTNSEDIFGVVDKNRTQSTTYGENTPIIMVNKDNERKSIFINAYNLWRWGFMSLRDQDITGMYDRFLEYAVKWLVNKEDSKLVRVSTGKEFYQNGEEVTINAQVYSENFNYVNDAEVQAVIRKEGVNVSRTLRSIGEGLYKTTLEILEPGEYNVGVEARLGDRLLGSDDYGFTIGKFSVELLKTSMDSLTLGQISAASNGRYFYPDEIDGLSEFLNNDPRIITEKYEFDFRNKWWLLILLIVLLCFEWFIRKRLGML